MNFLKRIKLKQIVSIAILVFVVGGSFIFTEPAFAEPCTIKDASGRLTLPTGCTPIAGGDGNTAAGGDSNSGVNIDTGIKNPLGDRYTDIPSFLQAILEFFILIGIPIVTLAIIYCGFLFVTAVGNSEKLKKAKQALIYTLIGAALLLGSVVIAKAIKGTVDDIKAERVIKHI